MRGRKVVPCINQIDMTKEAEGCLEAIETAKAPVDPEEEKRLAEQKQAVMMQVLNEAYLAKLDAEMEKLSSAQK